MNRKDFIYIWLSMTIVLLSILVAWAFVRWFDVVMLSVSVGAIFGMVSTIPVWLLFKVLYREPVAPVERIRPTVKRCAGDVSSINGEWRVVQ